MPAHRVMSKHVRLFASFWQFSHRLMRGLRVSFSGFRVDFQAVLWIPVVSAFLEVAGQLPGWKARHQERQAWLRHRRKKRQTEKESQSVSDADYYDH